MANEDFDDQQGLSSNGDFVEQQGHNHILRVRQDSTLDELFKAAIDGKRFLFSQDN